jgi:enoyl-CoA hydratase/carnithine racemase
MRIMKQQLYQAWMEPLSETLEKSIRLMVESFGRPDFREGVQSFLEKRPPDFERI